MNSNAIFDLIEAVAATPGKNDKQAMIASALQDDDVQKALEYAYNPFKRFYISKYPGTIGAHVGREFDAGTWELLDDILSRKLTGQAAIDAVKGELTALSEQSAQLLWRIIKGDMRAGFSESTINKAVKGLIPEFPYMRCCLPKDTDLAKFDWKLGVLSQEKADGMFTNVDHTDDGSVLLTTRQGTPIPLDAFAGLVREVQTLPRGYQMHGELLVLKGGVVAAREIGNGILNHVIAGGAFEADEAPVYVAWDSIPLTSVTKKGKCETKYLLRYAALRKGIEDIARAHLRIIPTRMVRSLEEAYVHYRELLADGKEGTVIKDPHAIWKDGTSKHQVKLKLEVDVDLKVTAIVPGREGTKNDGRPGSLRMTTSCGELVVDVTIKNEKLRDQIEAEPDTFIDRIWAVRANAIMNPSASSDVHSLFLPRMVEAGYRIDKVEADSLQRVKDQFEAAVAA